MPPLRLFVGHDPREAAGLHVFIESLLDQASGPVQLTVLTAKVTGRLGGKSDGSNDFTKSRFLVPALCDYRSRALYMDGCDMLMRGDIHEIAAHLDDVGSAVQVVKHDYVPKAARKYIATEMESPNVSYPRKNWSSVMGFWCDNAACRRLTPEYVAKATGQQLHRFEWVDDTRIGELSALWNWLDEFGENPAAKVVHYTNGIPGFAAYRGAPHADEWHKYSAMAQRGMAA